MTTCYTALPSVLVGYTAGCSAHWLFGWSFKVVGSNPDLGEEVLSVAQHACYGITFSDRHSVHLFPLKYVTSGSGEIRGGGLESLDLCLHPAVWNRTGNTVCLFLLVIQIHIITVCLLTHRLSVRWQFNRIFHFWEFTSFDLIDSDLAFSRHSTLHFKGCMCMCINGWPLWHFMYHD